MSLDPLNTRRLVGIALLATGVGVLAVSFAIIVAKLGALAVWNIPAHEDGIRTFGDTVLYFEHAIRELPLDVVLGVTIGGALSFAMPLAPRRMPRRYLVALAFLLFVMFAGALHDVGPKAAFDNLLQYHTRPGAPLEWGAHWRYHMLASLSLMLLAFGGAGLFRLFAGAGTAEQSALGARIVGGCLAVLALGSLIFAHSIGGLIEPFADPIFIGHAARELFTHVLATMPIAFGVGILLARETCPASDLAARRAGQGPSLVAIAAGVLVGLYLCGLAVALDSASSGQTGDFAMLIAPHFFEHAQTYLVVTLVALITHRLAAGSR
jgi:hypothetical protein